MSNFKINTNELSKDHGIALLHMLKETGETQRDILEKMLDIAERYLNSSTLETDYVDSKGSDTSME